MADVDLRSITFRSFNPAEGAPAPIGAPSVPVAGAINLHMIKYRAWVLTPPIPPDPPPVPDNNDLVDSIQLTGLSGSVSGDNTSGDSESANEISWNRANVPSVWYYWKNTTGVEQLFTLQELIGGAGFAAYGGAFVYLWPWHSGTLATGFDDVYPNNADTRYTSDAVLRSSYDRYGRIHVPAGEIVYIQVINYNSDPAGQGDFTFDWETLAFSLPANDDFANAITLTGSSGTLQGNNEFATPESPNDPLYDIAGQGQHTVWYKINSAGADRLVTLSTDYPTSGIPMTDTYIGLYKGTTLAGLTLIEKNDDSGVDNYSLISGATLPAGETGYVEVTGYDNFEAGEGYFTLNWTIV